jgi:hypothetical protein
MRTELGDDLADRLADYGVPLGQLALELIEGCRLGRAVDAPGCPSASTASACGSCWTTAARAMNA